MLIGSDLAAEASSFGRRRVVVPKSITHIIFHGEQSSVRTDKGHLIRKKERENLFFVISRKGVANRLDFFRNLW